MTDGYFDAIRGTKTDADRRGIKTTYNKQEYQEAKKYINGAEVVKRFSTPTFTNTVYLKDGFRWQESESHLEPPEDGYSLKLVDA